MHVGIIMDGNGRWAAARGLPRLAGHRRGADAVRRAVETAPACGIRTLTLYAFSSDNWKRPADEVNGIMHLFHTYLLSETRRCLAQSVKISLVGRRDRLPAALLPALRNAEESTRHCESLHLRLAVDYSSRDLILDASRRCSQSGQWSREAFAAALGQAGGADMAAPDLDLLIRTGGEQRLSDFLLWESAYAELLFLPDPWPEFSADKLRKCVSQFLHRDRRFGQIPLQQSV